MLWKGGCVLGLQVRMCLCGLGLGLGGCGLVNITDECYRQTDRRRHRER